MPTRCRSRGSPPAPASRRLGRPGSPCPTVPYAAAVDRLQPEAVKLTRKFIAALVLGVVVVLGIAALVNYQRERDLFDGHLRQDAVVLGRAIGHGFKLVWDRDGEHAA